MPQRTRFLYPIQRINQLQTSNFHFSIITILSSSSARYFQPEEPIKYGFDVKIIKVAFEIARLR